MNQKLTIIESGFYFVDMNPKKPKSRLSKSAGISLEPNLIKRGKDFAEKNGFGSLSNWTRFLLTQELSRAEGKASYTLQENSPIDPLPHNGGDAGNSLDPSVGGSNNQAPVKYKTKRQANSSR